jgi:ketosteroid isomerase-like protein
MGTDEQTIRQAHAAWLDAVNTGDIARLLMLMTLYS